MILVDGRLSFDELQWRLVTYRSTGYDGPVRADRPTSLSRYDAALLIGITRSECGVTVSGRGTCRRRQADVIGELRASPLAE